MIIKGPQGEPIEIDESAHTIDPFKYHEVEIGDPNELAKLAAFAFEEKFEEDYAHLSAQVDAWYENE